LPDKESYKESYKEGYKADYAESYGPPPPNRAWAEINLDNIRHNYREFARITRRPGASPGIICVIKANAYGHGAATLAKVYAEEGCAFLAAACLDEALEIRRAVDTPLLILNHIAPERIPAALENGLSLTVYSEELARAVSYNARRMGLTAKIHIKLDTGMTRAGFDCNERGLKESVSKIQRISELPNIKIEGVFTHFARADEADPAFTRVQFERYMAAAGELYRGGVDCGFRHVCNSAGAISFREMHLDLIRPGISLYGLYPSDEVDKSLIDLRPAMSVKARITRVHEADKGVGVSYGHDFVTARRTRLATLPYGYADGFPRLLSGKVHVLIRGRRCPVVGRICMDSCVADITDLDAAGDNSVSAGDEAVIIGAQGSETITADELARQISTISYEIVCMQSRRVPRYFFSGGALVSCENYLLEARG